MLKSKIKVFSKYFRRKPRRIVIWLTIVAVLGAALFQAFRLDVQKARAFEGVVLNPIGLPANTIAIGRSPSFAGNNYCFVNDEFIINKDGFLLQKMMAKVNGSCDDVDDKFIGYRYYTNSSSNKIATIPPNYTVNNAVQVDSSTNLIIGSGSLGGATVYMESKGEDSANALLLDGLTVENNAVLKQVPADREGYNTVYTRERDWAAVFYGYIFIPVGVTIELSIDFIGSDSDDAAYIYSTDDPSKISSVQFTSQNDISQLGILENYIDTFGAHYNLSGSTVTYSRDNRASDIGGPITYSNATPNDQYYPIMIFYRRYDKGGTVQMALKQKVISGGISYVPLNSFSPPVFEPIGNNWIGRAPANSGEFSAGKMAFAYYNIGYGYNPSYAFMPADPSIVNYRSYFTESIDLNRIPGKNDTSTNNLDTSFSYIYEFNNSTNTFTVPNPISNSQRSEGADYLRTSLITNSVNDSPIKADIRSKLGYARINLKVAKTVNVVSGASIDTTGLGYPGGIKNYSLPENDVRFTQYGGSIPDNVANGAGPGGGAYDNQNKGYCGLGGAYGGLGRGCADTINHINSSTYDNNFEINDPFSLGSGGGGTIGGPDAPGGSSGGSIRIEANDILIDNGRIKSNGGHGYNNGSGADQISLEQLNYPGWIGNRTVRGAAGSGGSVYLIANNQFKNSNNGRITAYGVTGGAEAYDAFNTDLFARCDSINVNCKGSASGGGRISILYGSGTSRSTDIIIDPSNDNNLQNDSIRVTGGFSDIYEAKLNNQDDYEFLPPRGGDGSIVIQSFSNATSVTTLQNINIDKKVERCSTSGSLDLNACLTNDATVQDRGDWFVVTIVLTNNTSNRQTGVKVTDEKFSQTTSYQEVGNTPGGATFNSNNSNNTLPIEWTGIAINPGSGGALTFRYAFKYQP